MMKPRLNLFIKDASSWVVLTLFLVCLPHIPRLPWWAVVAMLLLGSWRLAIIYNKRYAPSKIIIALIAVFLAVLSYQYYGSFSGKTAGTGLLCLMLFSKLMESNSKRDHLLLLFLSFFVIATNFLYSQSFLTALYMLLCTLLIISSLISINQQNAPINVQQKLKMAARITVHALPVMIIAFVFFPRIQGPLWSIKNDPASAKIGLSDTMEPGRFSQLIDSGEIAFRVKFNEAIPGNDKLYWRALVLWYFDGQRWEQGKDNPNSSHVLEYFGGETEYTVTMEPHDKKWLFALDMPGEVSGKNELTANYLLSSKSPIESLYQYSATSYQYYRIEKQLGEWERSAGLKIPSSLNPQSIQLAQSWRQQGLSDADIVTHALQMFNQQNFSYTLRPPLLISEHQVDEFLFETRQGFCEHYASAFAFLMRAAGVPTRVVIGYQGGQINPINQYLVVDQSMAHAWNEVWLKDEGWVRVDPTAAIAPQRVDTSLAEALSATGELPAHLRLDSEWLKTMKNYFDALDNTWDQFVLGYGPKLQKEFLSRLTGSNLSLADISQLFLITLAVILAIAAVLFLRTSNKQPVDMIQQLYNSYCKKLSRAALTRQPHEGPNAFASRIIKRRPTLAVDIRLITDLYIRIRYRSDNTEENIRELKQMIRSFHPKKT